MSADKAPAEKLPLAARKNVRDGWEAKKPELEAKLLAHLGVPWTFEVNPLIIYPYAEKDSYGHNSLGDCINAYFEAFEWTLRDFISKHGDTGKDELNTVCSAHIATLIPSTKFNYCGTDVEDGKLRLLFHPNYLGTNINDVAYKLAETLSEAPQPAGAPTLSYAARHSIKTNYDSKIEELSKEIRDILKNPEFKFEPGFNELGEKLKGGKDVRDDWETNLGLFALKYFESLLDTLKSEKFGEDELLREGLEEGVPKGVVKIRIVDKLGRSYNETVLEDGALVIQTTPEYWGTNIHYACDKLVDIL
ncbi:hypothetical protein G7Y89_g3041 [Cudoniella acicularis]|uniref:Uncharacterized protein n=1 Tax=Cudoniella acicularis TaxID=354080 RepID=A0A8H4RV44_9HELO|nr:hypothetical protein G7Y89_g3041 [Cudoniella acicularis]